MAPSPSVFLVAAAQRSSRLRFGPLLYVTPMYHPLRVAEEVVMLDHMSRGRLELGLGRGASPVEIASFDVDPASAPAMNREAIEVILKALASEILDHDGKFYRFKNVCIAARPLQQPASAALVCADRAIARGRRGKGQGQHRDAYPRRRCQRHHRRVPR